jgi:Circularly permutated YpsA SLOG family
VLHIYDTRLQTKILTDFLRSNRIEVLNVAGPRESKDPSVYEWALSMLPLRSFSHALRPEVRRRVGVASSITRLSAWRHAARGFPCPLDRADLGRLK